MSRSMIEANMAVFALLDEAAKQRGSQLQNEGQKRWIATDAADKEILKNFELTYSFRLASNRVIARFDRAPDNLFIVVGFDEALSNWLTVEDVGAGLLTATISELKLTRLSPTHTFDIAA